MTNYEQGYCDILEKLGMVVEAEKPFVKEVKKGYKSTTERYPKHSPQIAKTIKKLNRGEAYIGRSKALPEKDRKPLYEERRLKILYPAKKKIRERAR